MEANQCPKSVGAFNKKLDQKPDYLEVHLQFSTCHNKVGINIKADQHVKIWNSRNIKKSH